MSKIPDSVMALARQMCIAVDIDPDETFPHGYGYSPYPTNRRNDGGAVPAGLLYSPNWHRFAWEAHKWIFETSGGDLPKR